MVKVASSMIRSNEPFVNVTIYGVSEARHFLEKFTKELVTKEQQALVTAGNFAQNEVKESIIGNRAEPKSVDTGRFANSISLKPISTDKIAIYTDVEYAPCLEYGTSRMMPRSHFRNTAFRITKELKGIFKAQISAAKKETGTVNVNIQK